MLTDIGIRNLKPGAVRREIPDRTPLLYLVVQPSGRRRFVLRYRFHGVSRKVTLQAGITLAVARKLAADAALDLERDIDPRENRKEARRKAAESRANTLSAVVAEYLQRDSKLRTIGARERLLRRHVLPVLGERSIASIRRNEIVRLLDRVEDKSGTRTADVVLSVLRRVCNWHSLRDESYTPPFTRGMRRKLPSESERSRVLSDDELRRVWAAADAAGPFGVLVKLLMFTCARRGEVVGLVWHEIKGDVWHLPGARAKNKQDLQRPLSAATLALIQAQPHFDGCPFVLSGDGRRPLADHGAAKRALDEASGVSGWTIHDLRRCARSLLSRAGVSADIAERCLGHSIGGVRGTYDRHRYIDEMRKAFEALASLVEHIVDPQPNIAVMRGKQGG
jgi:integrase